MSPRLMRDLRAISALNVALHNSATFTPNKVYCVRSRHKGYRLLDEQLWAASAVIAGSGYLQSQMDYVASVITVFPARPMTGQMSCVQIAHT